MKIVKKHAAQGDVMFVRVDTLPEGVTKKSDGLSAVVAHSETGHHHVAKGERVMLYGTEDPMVCYLVAEGVYADVEHLRPWDTHETLRLDGEPGAVWKIVRQRESTPEGWRRVED